MKLTLVLLLFLGVGVLARSPAVTGPKAELAVNESDERSIRSASSESREVSAAKSAESREDKSQRRGSSEENKGGSKESTQLGGKSKESGEDADQLNGENTGGAGNKYANVFKHLATVLGSNGVRHISDLVAKYCPDSLPIPVETLLKTLGITSSLEEMQDTSGLYQMMKNVPIVGIIVKFMTNSMFIPINIIALLFSLGTTVIQHMHKSLPTFL